MDNEIKINNWISKADTDGRLGADESLRILVNELVSVSKVYGVDHSASKGVLLAVLRKILKTSVYTTNAPDEFGESRKWCFFFDDGLTPPIYRSNEIDAMVSALEFSDDYIKSLEWSNSPSVNTISRTCTIIKKYKYSRLRRKKPRENYNY